MSLYKTICRCGTSKYRGVINPHLQPKNITGQNYPILYSKQKVFMRQEINSWNPHLFVIAREKCYRHKTFKCYAVGAKNVYM